MSVCWLGGEASRWRFSQGPLIPKKKPHRFPNAALPSVFNQPTPKDVLWADGVAVGSPTMLSQGVMAVEMNGRQVDPKITAMLKVAYREDGP
jgi:hypothetical protein